MTKASPNTSTIVRYLLGRLPEGEQTGFEERMLESEALFEALEEAESELIDEYVSDRLSADDRRRFELYFLTQPERRARVEFARALREAAAEHGREKRSWAARPESDASPGAAAWRRVASLIPRPQFAALAAWRLVAVFAIFAILGGLIMALIDNSRLRQQLQQAQTERSESQQRSAAQLAAAESELSNERSLRQRFEDALDHLNTGPKESGQPAIVSFVLSTFFRPARGAESQSMPKSQQLLIPAAAKRVSLTLPVQVQSPDFTSYRISLRRAEDPGEIWGRSGLPAVSKPGQRIRIGLPAGLLVKGEYRLKLSGVLSDENTEPIGEYRFAVVRD